MISFLKDMKYCPMAILHQTRTYTFKNILNALGKDADYIFSAMVWAEELTKILPLVREVNFMLKSRCGENFNSVNSRSFTGIYVLLDAIARVGFSRPPSHQKSAY